MKDTPETDPHVWKGHCGDLDWQDVVSVGFARKLERELDELRGEVRRFVEDYRQVVWGWDGCGGVTRMVDRLEEVLGEKKP